MGDQCGNVGLGTNQLPVNCQQVMASNFNMSGPVEIESAQQSRTSGFVRPLGSTKSGSPYVFVLESQANSFLQLSSLYIYAQCKITKEDGSDLTAANTCGVINGLGYRWVDSCKTELNDYEYNSSSNQHTGLKQHIEVLTSFDPTSAHSHLSASLFNGEKTDAWDDMTAVTSNKHFNARVAVVAESKLFEFVGPVPSDFCRSATHLAPGNKIVFTLYQAPDEVLLQTADQSENYKLTFVDLRMYYSRIYLKESVFKELSLTKQSYFCPRTELKTFSIAKNLTSYNTLLFSNPLPKTLVVCMQETNRFTGKYALNANKFHHFNLSKLNVTLNSKSIQAHPYELDFENNLIGQAFYDGMMNLGLTSSNRACLIDRHNFANGFALFVINVGHFDGCNSYHVHQSQHKGVLQLEATFAKPLTDTITFHVYGSYDQLINIDPSTGRPEAVII